jgi:hypothetical protein
MLLCTMVGIDVRLGSRVLQYTLLEDLSSFKHQAQLTPRQEVGHFLSASDQRTK